MRQCFIRLDPVRRCMIRVIDKRIVLVQPWRRDVSMARVFQHYNWSLRSGQLRHQQKGKSSDTGKKRLAKYQRSHCGISMNSAVLPTSVLMSRLSFNGVSIDDIGATDVTRMICQGVSVPLATAREF